MSNGIFDDYDSRPFYFELICLTHEDCEEVVWQA